MSLFLILNLLFSLRSEALLPAPDTAVKTGIGFMAPANDSYRIGDEWGKLPVTAASLDSATPAFRRAALATAQTGGATGFYLGKFRGRHVMATNFHVFRAERACLGSRIRFPLLGLEGRCGTFLGSWSDIDLALFTLDVNAADEAKLEAVGRNFDFHSDIRASQRMLTIGFGVAGNSSRKPMANQDSDCYAFSETGEYRFMEDPDQWNPGGYSAWSFALGCDVSHGDSGSAIVDRESGQVVGIIWTGKIPKSSVAQSSESLNEIFRTRSESLWTELSYAVPAKKMGEHLKSVLGTMPAEKREIVEALLQ